MQFVARHVPALLLDDDEQRSLLPFRMRDADHRRFGDRWMTYRRIFDIDGRYPFAA